ncbi:MAG TPA: alpha/beta fold hydrolase [Acidimicrobiales bacterium]
MASTTIGQVSGASDALATLPGAEERTVALEDGAELAVTVAPGTADTTVAAGAVASGRAGDQPGVAGTSAAPTTAPTVLFAHGWTNNRSVWLPAARAVAAAGHPVVLYDQRGHGASTRGTAPLGVERLGDDLAALVQALDVRDAVLVGHSMGGFTIMSFACRHRALLTERARGLALVSTAAHGLSMRWMTPVVERLLRSRTVERVVRARGGSMFVRRALGRRPRPEAVRSTRQMFVDTPAEVRAGFFATFGAMDLRLGLADLELPTRVLVGDRDTLTPPRLSQVIADTIPGARLERLPDAGHMLPLERTGQVVEAVLALAR